MTPIDVLNCVLVRNAIGKSQWSVGNLRRLRIKQSQLTRRGGQLSSKNQTSSGCASKDDQGSQATESGPAFAKAKANRSGLGFLFHTSFAISSSFDIRISSFDCSPTAWALASGAAL